MNGKEMAQIRGQLALDRVAFARLLGYTGTDRNDDTRIRKYENDKQQIPLYIARLVVMVLTYHTLTKALPEFPSWPGYDYDHSPDPEPYELQSYRR